MIGWISDQTWTFVTHVGGICPLKYTQYLKTFFPPHLFLQSPLQSIRQSPLVPLITMCLAGHFSDRPKAGDNLFHKTKCEEMRGKLPLWRHSHIQAVKMDSISNTYVVLKHCDAALKRHLPSLLTFNRDRSIKSIYHLPPALTKSNFLPLGMCSLSW